jgi:hypothetical protein
VGDIPPHCVWELFVVHLTAVTSLKIVWQMHDREDNGYRRKNTTTTIERESKIRRVRERGRKERL